MTLSHIPTAIGLFLLASTTTSFIGVDSDASQWSTKQHCVAAFLSKTSLVGYFLLWRGFNLSSILLIIPFFFLLSSPFPLPFRLSCARGDVIPHPSIITSNCSSDRLWRVRVWSDSGDACIYSSLVSSPHPFSLLFSNEKSGMPLPHDWPCALFFNLSSSYGLHNCLDSRDHPFFNMVLEQCGRGEFTLLSASQRFRLISPSIT